MARVRLQHPIPAHPRSPRQIHRRRHIRPGSRRQLLNKRLPRIPLRHIAAIQQDVARLCEHAADVGQLRTVVCKVAAVQHGATQIQGALAAMRDDVQGINADAAL